MKYKYIFLIFFSLTSYFIAPAQEIVDYSDFFKQREYPKSLLYMKLGYEHTQINGSNINTEMVGIYTPANWVDVYGGFHVSSRNLYQAAVRGDFKWWIGETRNLALRNQYSYSAYADENFQNLNMSLMLVYDQEHLYAAFGGYAQFFTNFFIKLFLYYCNIYSIINFLQNVKYKRIIRVICRINNSWVFLFLRIIFY